MENEEFRTLPVYAAMSWTLPLSIIVVRVVTHGSQSARHSDLGQEQK
jgi:hypothetical protein